MTRAHCRALAAALLLFPLLARAEGKCDDDPYLWKDPSGKEMLVVTWTIPYPADAKVDPDVAAADRSLMADLDARLGAEPPGFPAEYSSNVVEYPYPPHPNSRVTLRAVKEIDAYLQGFAMRLEPEAVPHFDQYYKQSRVVYARVVQHPPAPDNGRGFRFCTCTLQRAVALWEGGQERLLLRSRFRSARDTRTFVNFAPAGPVKFTFASKTIWFPLALNRILPEPGAPAFLLLDVLTRKKLDAASIPNSFSYDQPAGTVRYSGADWYVTRIWRKYQRGDPADDMALPAP